MRNIAPRDNAELEAIEQREWLESLDYVLQQGDRGRVQRLLATLRTTRAMNGVGAAVHAPSRPTSTRSPPTSRRRCPAARRSSAASRAWSAGTRWRWSSARTSARDGIGGHISTYASAATLYEVGFNHFFRGKGDDGDGDIIYFQGHASPGIYARAFLEGRLSARQLENFRRELKPGGGLSSYPHPWLMPDFWEFPTVSMGLGPIMAIYQARFIRYLEDRGLKQAVEQQGLGVPRRRRDRRARIARRDHAGGAREARQPDLRHQLQPAAARRSGARQRPDHPGARSGLPRRRLERHQGALGQRLGSAAREGSRRPARQAHGRDRRRRSIRSTPSKSGAYIREHFFGADPRLLEHGQAPVRRAAEEADARRPRSGQGLQRLQGGRRAQGRSRRSSSRARSRATASAKRAKARTSPTSRRR